LARRRHLKERAAEWYEKENESDRIAGLLMEKKDCHAYRSDLSYRFSSLPAGIIANGKYPFQSKKIGE
jgi:hypothetical protein